MGLKRADKTAQYWRLITLLLVLVAMLVVAALLAPGYSTGFLISALPIAGVALWLIRFYRNELESWRVEIENQLPVDRETGAATLSWFRAMLEQECRRAIREFTPITIIKLLPINRKDSLHNAEYVELLKERMTRPGDLVALDVAEGLILLLPSTNEAVVKFAERLFQVINDQHSGTHLFGYTFQPVSDLNSAKVSDILSQLQDNLPDSPKPQLKIESEGFDMPNVTYSI